MRFLLIGISFFYNSSAFAICDPMAVAGNINWVNPNNSNLITTNEVSIIRGNLCEDNIFVNSANVTNSSQNDFAYFLPEIEFNSGRYNFDFAVDFAEILPVIGTGNKIDFLELLVEPQFNPNNTLHRIAKVRIKKKPLEGSDEHGWKVHIIWSDLPDYNNNVVTNGQDFFWLPSDIQYGLLHFNVSWSNHSSQGGLAYINIISDMRDSNDSPIYIDTSETFETLPSPDQLSLSRTFQSPFFQQNTILAETRIGIIAHDEGVNYGDGLTFYRPLY